MNSAEPREQAAAVQTVASFREPADAERFLAALGTNTGREVRLALLNGLSYIGTGSATAALLAALAEPDEQIATEAVAALGRLAERGVIDAELRDNVSTALLAAFERTQPSQVVLRERTLWAMGNLINPQFGPAFADALAGTEAVAVRQAALLGLAALKSAQWADAVAGAVSDPDPGVRRLAIETLPGLISTPSERQLQALWERATSGQEPEEAIRQSAGRGLTDLLARAALVDVDRFIARLVSASSRDGQRTIELLERLLAAAEQADPVDPARLGTLRARLADLYARGNQPAPALVAYHRALRELAETKLDLAPVVARDLLKFALATGLYDEQVAITLRPFLRDAEPTWEIVRAELEAQLTPSGVDRALAMAAALEQHPPGSWPAGPRDELRRLRERAQQLKQGNPATAPVEAANARPAPGA